jgi:hypothetical protein
MSLLDLIKRPFERIGTNLENYMGGLLGEDVEGMTPEERRRLRQRAIMAISEGMATMTPVSTTLREAADEEMARRQRMAQRRQAEQRMGAAQQASSQIAGRLLGGAPIPTAPGPAAGDELMGVNVQSQYRRDPMDALRMSMTPGGMDAMQLSPQLSNFLSQNVGQQVVGGSIYDRATGQFMRPPAEQVQTLTPQELAQLGLPAGTVAQRDPQGRINILREPPARATGGGFRLLSEEEVAAAGLPKGTVAQLDESTGKVNLLSQVPQAERVKLERGARTVGRVEQGIENLTKHLDKVTTGGVMGISGAVSRIFDSQDAQQFNSFKEQLSSALRAALRIPGEGALSDFEQRQYGLTLPSLNLSKERNLQIMSALADQVRLDSGMPTIDETRPPEIDPHDWFRMLPSERAAYLRAGAEQ